MRRNGASRSADSARKALMARKQRIARLAAGLKQGADETQSAAERRPDTLDRATELEGQDVFAQLQSVETREMAEIDAALQRLAAGTYGQCERCGEEIGMLRLRALPEARFCMGCSGR
ncbi:MAG TPA: TraR/DksA family transcriptional regulator [Myxococcales bacterium]|nr:TraR/DksA family transcriptional regulator [Myxococcales bacterium]